MDARHIIGVSVLRAGLSLSTRPQCKSVDQIQYGPVTFCIFDESHHIRVYEAYQPQYGDADLKIRHTYKYCTSTIQVGMSTHANTQIPVLYL